MAKIKGLTIAFLLIIFLGLITGGYLYFKKIFPGRQSTSELSFENSSEEEEENTQDEETDISPEIAQPRTSDLQVSAWIANWATTDGLNSFEKSDVVTSVSPTWYYVKSDGTLGFKSGSHSVTLISKVHNKGGKVIPSISNPSADELSKILNDTKLKQKLIASILYEVKTYRYDGIDIDFEEINAEDKTAFTSFIKDLGEEIHNEDKLLTIAVLAKTDKFIYSLSESRIAQDWSKITPYVDEFRIMGYDFEHNSTTSAGPVAPLPWLEDILSYAVKQVPREKIVLGLPLYGYHWVKGGKTTSFTWQTEQELEKSWGIKGKLDSESKEKFLINGNSELWYQDAESIGYRIKLAEKYKVRGVVFWRLGREDPAIWELF